MPFAQINVQYGVYGGTSKSTTSGGSSSETKAKPKGDWNAGGFFGYEHFVGKYLGIYGSIGFNYGKSKTLYGTDHLLVLVMIIPVNIPGGTFLLMWVFKYIALQKEKNNIRKLFSNFKKKSQGPLFKDPFFIYLLPQLLSHLLLFSL